VARFNVQLLISENAVTIPLNLPLGLAITEFLIETGLPMVAHHHDFFWERKRFLNNACWDYLSKAFPPHLPRIQHAVLNSSQDNQLSLRTGISAIIIPNVMDFRNPPQPADVYSSDLRKALGIQPGEKFILQPTRVVQRKGIERAIELVSRLDIPCRLVISHASGDEGDEYSVRVREYSDLLGVKTVFCSDILRDKRATLPDGRKLYTLADMYHEADLVTYCSRVEGFGNAFLEAIYYRKPIVVNNYASYSYDIRPKGFLAAEMDEHPTKALVKQTRDILENPEIAMQMAEHNYRLAERFFSYEILEHRLNGLLENCFGSD
jgi:glycosyltransferase involved in cell wall biosynthesis